MRTDTCTSSLGAMPDKMPDEKAASPFAKATADQKAAKGGAKCRVPVGWPRNFALTDHKVDGRL